MNNKDEAVKTFLSIYNQIDRFLRIHCSRDTYADHTSLISELTQSNRVVARYQQELRTMAQLRNLLVHNPIQNIDEPFAWPSPSVVKRYSEISKALLNPINALSIAVLAHKIYTASPKSNAVEVIQTMNKHTYTHVPIIDEDIMIGVFSENTLLSYLAKKGEAIITNDMLISNFKEFIPLHTHGSESFEFLSRKANLSDVYELFNKAIKVHKRIGMVFVTQNGKPHEKPLGIITAWDLASPVFEF